MRLVVVLLEHCHKNNLMKLFRTSKNNSELWNWQSVTVTRRIDIRMCAASQKKEILENSGII